ncbi:MAG: V-type ATPase subunit [Symbiobacteriaceae bacterium]|nr:V-type ATPase subunit [Symbiobacteriaceae bacterium]
MSDYRNAYAVGYIRALEGKLLRNDRIARMLDAPSAAEVLNILIEAGYGQGSEPPDEFEALIATEQKRTLELMQEISSQLELTELFYLHYDLHNCKLLYKGRYSGERLEGELFSLLGTIPLADLRVAMEEKDYSLLPQAWQEVLQETDSSVAERLDPGLFDVQMDVAYYKSVWKHIQDKKIRFPFVSQYFALSADFNNLLQILRLKLLGKPSSLLPSIFLPGGSLTLATLAPLWEGELERDAWGHSPFAAALAKGWLAYQQRGSIADLEKERDNALFRLAGEGDQGPLSIGPVLRYLHYREQETKVVRLIMTGKTNRIPDRLLRERVRELYA